MNQPKRPPIDVFMMQLAQVAALRSTCIKRSVGCVLANARGQVLSIGYNGVASGRPHCFDGTQICKDFDKPSGFDCCEAVHAEQNAILQCHNAFDIETAYVTLSPCKACIKLLMNTSCKRIVFLNEHDDPQPKAFWLSTSTERSWAPLNRG